MGRFPCRIPPRSHSGCGRERWTDLPPAGGTGPTHRGPRPSSQAVERDPARCRGRRRYGAPLSRSELRDRDLHRGSGAPSRRPAGPGAMGVGPRHRESASRHGPLRAGSDGGSHPMRVVRHREPGVGARQQLFDGVPHRALSGSRTRGGGDLGSPAEYPAPDRRMDGGPARVPQGSVAPGGSVRRVRRCPRPPLLSPVDPDRGPCPNGPDPDGPLGHAPSPCVDLRPLPTSLTCGSGGKGARGLTDPAATRSLSYRRIRPRGCHAHDAP